MKKLLIPIILVLLSSLAAIAHDWHRHEDPQFANLQPLTLAEAELIADEKLAIQEAAAAAPVLFQPAGGPAFAPVTLSAANLYAQTFLKFNPSVRFWWDTTSFHVESDSIPAHNLMEGISSWQRQIPIPIYYFGTNNWLLPLYPVPTNSPLLITSNTFTRGAIALAANGIPIFNPYNNTGRASALIGELDRFGGHCGRADDYHYHVAPLHLTNVLGLTLPVAFALDGYPIYGLTEPDGAAIANLDSLQGHTNGTGSYHYHASLSLPYLNAGFHGTVAYVGGQVDPQPSAGGIRPAGTPLAGAFIQIFTNLAPDQFQMFFSVPSNAPPTNYWLYTLNRAAKTVSVTYSPYDIGGGVTTTNYANWKPAPAYTSTNAPLVTVQPTNTTKALGATATFTLSAAGFGTLAYQWFKDGVEMSDGGGISGMNTTTLTIANVQNSDAASYSVVVTNVIGNTMSASAVLTVSGVRSISQGRAITITSNLYPAGQRVSGVGSITALDGTVWTVPSATPFATSPKAPDLYNETVGVTPTNIAAVNLNAVPIVEIDPDGEVITGYLFGDNYFELYVNGVLVGVDPVPYTPFNSCVVKFKAKRPITYAVRLVDWEENLGLGTELNGGNPNYAGDGGFMASFSDGTVTGPNWKAQSFYISPLDNPNLVVETPDGSHNSSGASNQTTLGTNAYALHYLVPTNWFSKSFNHSNWPAAVTYSEATVGVNNKPAYLNFPAQFSASGAQFIWSGNLVLDNEVIVRFTGPASSNTAPVFSAFATNRYVINGGATISVSNAATDADLPAQSLTYSLFTAPVGATINSSNGVVNWITTTNHSGTSNFCRLVVTDNGSPNLTATNNFTVFVRSLKPNVIIIVTDDHGYHDLSAHGAEAPTPNMDRLGTEGVRLERFYATPVCSVTRSTFLTGRTTLRTATGNARGLHFAEHTLPQTFKAAGYQAFMVGKWHLGGFYNNDTNTVINGVTNLVVKEGVDFQPQNRGWDFHYGQYGGAIGYLTHNSAEPGFNTRLDWWLNGVTNLDAGWSTDLEADKAVSLLQSRDPSQPVILYLAFNAVHPGVSAPTAYLNKYLSIADVQRRTMVAALDQMDVGIGRVLDTIDAEGIRTNTLVVVFSDNGADTNSGGLNIPLRGTKNDYFEAGIHTPAAVRWPGVIPAGVTNCNQFISVADWFPTICAATGVTPLNTKPFDGTNVWPLLLGATNGEFNPTNYRGRPLFSSSASAQTGAAVYDVFSNGTNLTMFKLIHYKPQGSAVFTNLLFDIINDPLETSDVVANPAYSNIVLALTASYNATAVVEKYGPYIGVHPQSQSANTGSNVTLFAMTTVYTTPLGVQWRKNGTNIAGATSYAAVDNSVYLTTLNLANVTAADAATYDVVVTNAATGWANTVTSLPAVLTVLTNGGSLLTLTGVSASPPAPTSNDAVRVTVNIASSTTVTQALLSYSTGAGASTTNTVFAETMALTATSGTGGWDGTGAINPWTPLTLAGAGNIKQTIGANHGSGNPCGLELSKGSSDPAQTMVTTVNSINATGATGYVDFWVATVNVTNGLGWTFQLSTNGTTFITRLSETNGTVHAHQIYHYDLLPSERVSTLKMRFQFIGNGVGGPTAPKAQIDDITVVTTATGAATVNVALADDGAHQDGAPGDGVYGGAIPAFPNGTTVSYYLTAANSGGQSATNPIGAPASQFSYTVATAVVSNGWSMLKLPDTGQTTSYTTNPGEDSDYSINPPSFTDNGNGTTTDNVTGLMWQKADGGEMTISNALIFAQTTLNATNFAGYSDWRLPTVHELMSILNQDRSNPALDTNYFTSPGVVAGIWNQVYWWSRDQLRNGTNQWCANAGGGVGPKPITETISAGGTLNYRVRCVRGAPAPATSSPIHHFVNNSNGTITDTDTGLTWQQAEIGATTDWTNALNYAEGLVLGGFQDWRLPNIKELESLNDETLLSPSIDANYFPNAKSARYWSSTTQNNSTGNAWFNEFIAGITSQAAKTTNYWVRAVRGGLANTAPALAAISNRTVNAGVTVQFTNAASDAETAPGFLTYTLLTTTTGATLNATSGVFTWRPVVAQAGTTNLFSIVVADTGSPVQTATRPFTVTVNPLAEARVSSAGFSNGLFRLSIIGDLGPDYTVQASTNLTTWTNVFVTNSPTLPLNWTDTSSSNFLQRFYRVLLGP